MQALNSGDEPLVGARPHKKWTGSKASPFFFINLAGCVRMYIAGLVRRVFFRENGVPNQVKDLFGYPDFYTK